jgi:hypothetical protein
MLSAWMLIKIIDKSINEYDAIIILNTDKDQW